MSTCVPESQRVQALAALPVPEAVARFLQSLDVPAGMRRLFKAPYKFYSPGSPDNPGQWDEFAARKMLPLWEHYDLIFAVDVSGTLPEYLSFYVDGPGDCESYGASIYRILFRPLYLHVWEFGGEEKEVREAQFLAEQLGFPQLAELKAILGDRECSKARIDAYLAARSGQS